jgi:hypothetical protein
MSPEDTESLHASKTPNFVAQFDCTSFITNMSCLTNKYFPGTGTIDCVLFLSVMVMVGKSSHNVGHTCPAELIQRLTSEPNLEARRI